MSSPKPTSPLAQGSPKRAAAALPAAASPKPAGGKVDKKAAQAAKAAKRAAAKGLAVGEQATTPVAAAGAGQHAGKDKGKSLGQAGAAAAGGSGKGGAASAQATAGGAKGGEGTSSAAYSAASDPLQLFLHLDLPSHSSQLSHSSKSSTSNIHPSILRLALQYSEFKIVGANARCIAMLEALKDVRGCPLLCSRAEPRASLGAIMLTTANYADHCLVHPSGPDQPHPTLAYHSSQPSDLAPHPRPSSLCLHGNSHPVS